MTRSRSRLGARVLVLLGLATLLQPALGQNNTNNNNNNNNTNSNLAGIAVDARGVLTLNRVYDRAFAETRRGISMARTSLPEALARGSKLRMVSLNRLEAAVKAELDAGRALPDEMRYLAGLTRVKYVFLLPESNDIVLAGPAEGWMVDLVGRVRGIDSGRPVIELRDLVVALRAFAPNQKDTDLISVSIDPTKDGLANLQTFLSQVGPTAFPGQERALVAGIKQSLGMQNITLKGIPSNTHFAQVLVEADYRMKLIGIGLERIWFNRRDKLASYVDHAHAGSRNAMQRWYFVPNYECVKVSEDELGMELVGEGVKLIGADELVQHDGTRVAAAAGDAAGKKFVQGFTTRYAEIAAKVPVYAQLRSLIDLAVAAAFIQEQDYYGQAGWTMEVFGNETEFPVCNVNSPSQVESAVDAVWKRNRLMTPVGGGVRIEASKALSGENQLAEEQGEVRSQREKISLDKLAEGQWWWD